MGRALARKMAERGDRLFLLGLLGPNQDELSRSAKDLELRGADGPVGTAACDLLAADSFGPALDQADEALSGFDTVVLTAGLFATQEELEGDSDLRQELLTANFVNSVQFCEEARKRLLSRGGGKLCVFSSVAGERARKTVILYGASKAGLTHYIEGLDHKFSAMGLRTILVKPGFVKTTMTAGLEPPPFAAEPEQVANVVLRAIDRNKPVVFVPGIWRWIMSGIRLLPRAVMRRIAF
jgi:decaprenylphospho-beta-D-erythro-pentofuranosid-2-ulose 2-reductase